ncbi:MAG: trifunctional transcriptional regulator/proline dehydrogenase/L-glutamate gamma-semialdehyde dehydrogenase [Candidatus Liberibacter ctenarytainae]|uniref:Bifunctional protein PutA n=1 Tax=Candidatus Liberibacter ctenarytainae TaxID=2020335 RepID=A0A937DHC9_9HYPH|nr:trifunctional transcriptional regulator/proline dehydrogenase/L-glutamate gamma-semialdehyde dehydrogenase [Candidatus Liberibacter ctenarytainae]
MILHIIDNEEIMVKHPTTKGSKKAKSLRESEICAHNNTNHSPFLNFAAGVLAQSEKRSAITSAYRLPETQLLPILLKQAQIEGDENQAACQLAYQLATKLREQSNSPGRSGLVQGLLQEFSLSSQEGIILMCLAEALLRIPDKVTRDTLIRNKISGADWKSHLGKSSSSFVNIASLGLFLTDKLVSNRRKNNFFSALSWIMRKSSEPIVRQAVNMGMRLMGEQFVTGETIDQALINVRKMEKEGFSYSYDMLGEAALTEEDSEAYMVSYQKAIEAIGQASIGKSIYASAGISIKLSALHPRYCRSQYQRVMDELYPRLLTLTLQARHYDIGINIDAEEADRLEISLDLLKKLCFEPQLSGWNGIGFVVQAYQKRCPYVIDEIIDLARLSQHRLMIRLVKGAYWDSEIKRSQIDGLDGYPVYTRKMYTDVSYLACARKLLAVPDLIYPQFATHNAHTLATIYYLAGKDYSLGQYEFQCLHGMGESLYQHVVGPIADGKLDRPCRIYAPVGKHETLLAYLVRRLLENGSNTSFVNRIADNNIPLEELISDPVQEVLATAETECQIGLPHPKIPQPRVLYGQNRLNSRGMELSNEHHLAEMAQALLASPAYYQVKPLLGGKLDSLNNTSEQQDVINPANHVDIVGYVYDSTMTEVEHAITVASQASNSWSSTSADERMAILQKAAELMEQKFYELIGVLVREAGKTYSNAISEVRETIDFLRYYAQQISDYDSTYSPLGAVVCISPWNFPLAIFTGQIAAALAAGNTVLAKPAEQTPIIAMLAVQLLHQAGIPRDVLQLLPGRGDTVGIKLISDKQTNGVIFTGSTYVAKFIQRNLAGRLNAKQKPIPLIAETGGLNTMIVDSSALTEQVVNDVVISAFDSAGQRCSALRVLCVQEEVAERTLTMLKGAMAECRVGNPICLETDIGPVIDRKSQYNIEKHIEKMRQIGKSIYQVCYHNQCDDQQWKKGSFVQPTLIEISHLSELKNEVFGPVLHVLRYKRQEIQHLIKQINDSGYGLTLGLHTRIDETISLVSKTAKVGNIYVNRNMVGAVVGVQPFGGEGLSGTGPKAGGPLYLYRLLSQRPDSAIDKIFAQQDSLSPFDGDQPPLHQSTPFHAFCDWAKNQHDKALDRIIHYYQQLVPRGVSRKLVGPTGEYNSYILVPRGRILCLAETKSDALLQLTAVLAMGCQVVWPDHTIQQQLRALLPPSVNHKITTVDNWKHVDCQFDAVVFHGNSQQLQIVCQEVASRDGPIIMIEGLQSGERLLPERLVHERAISINTAAAGGNTTLMMLG